MVYIHQARRPVDDPSVAAWVDQDPALLHPYLAILEAWQYARAMAGQLDTWMAAHFLKMFNPNVAVWYKFITTYDQDFRPDPALYVIYLKAKHHKRFSASYILSDKLIASYKTWLATQAIYYNSIERIPLFREYFRKKASKVQQ